MRRVMPIFLTLVLLAGCAGTPAKKPQITQSPAPTGPAVRTDWSKLEPKGEAHPPIYTRRYESWTDHLIPTGDYGRLYSFAGEKVPATERYMGEEEEGSPTTLYKYGLVSQTGEVVVDPVYDLVGPPCDRFYDGPSFYRPMPDLLLLGILVERKPDPDSEYEGPRAWEWRYGAVASDGSWCTELIYTGYSAADENTLLLWTETGETVVLDEDGTVRFTIPAGADNWAASAYDAGSWSEGMVLSSVNYPDYYFYDAQTGARLLGPYVSTSPFSEGLAAVRDEKTGLYGYIDKTGAWAIQPAFEQADWFSNGVAVVRVIGSLPALLGRDGQFILEANEGEQIAACGGPVYGPYSAETKEIWYLHSTAAEAEGENTVTVLGAYGTDGTPLAQPAAGETVNTWWDSAVSRVQGDKTIFYQNGTAYTLPLAGIVREASGEYVILQKVLSEGEYQYALVSLDGKILADYGACEYISLYVPPETGRLEAQFNTTDSAGEYHYETRALEPDDAPVTYVQEDWGCGYQDKDGNWVFRWPYLVLGDLG